MANRSREEGEEYRLRKIRQLEKKYGDTKPAEVLEAEKVIAKYRQEEVKANAVKVRCRAPLPAPDLCPQCWFDDGHRSTLRSVDHPEPAEYDRMKCKTCGYVDDQPA